MKLVVEQSESRALESYLVQRSGQWSLVSSWLLHAELHCASNRHPHEVDSEALAVVLDTVGLIDVKRGDLLTAGNLPGGLRSNDAIHLAVALRVGADEVLTYDIELAAAARTAGVAVTQPT